MSRLIELDRVDKILWSRLYKNKNDYNNCKNGLDKIPIIDEDKIRADTIDEFIKALERRNTFGDNEFEMGLDFTDVLEVAEQLKEKKND